ncbi:MAG: hypothetical protein M3498_04335 [Deinococcota bacterium]|nr:hypothetical protein [Deinococcota bacterium]
MKSTSRRMFTGWVVALVLGLSTCVGAQGAPAVTAPWALGEQPNFSGTLIDWTKGDAIASGDGAIFATTYPDSDSEEGVGVGFGHVSADGSYTFGLQRIDASAPWLVLPVFADCAGIIASNAQQKVASVTSIEIPGLYEEGVHARPGGAIHISSYPFTLSPERERYIFAYANADGTVKGSCDAGEGFGLSYDLDLRKDWNSLRLNESMSGIGIVTAAIPEDAYWYFVNPLTVPAD